jgi:hypothetical protein
MRLTTIWTMPNMTLAERIRRTVDLAAQTAAVRLPKRVRYWAFIQQGAAGIPPNAIVPEVRFMDVLARIPGGPD